MNLQEARQLLGLIYSMSTWDGNSSTEAMNLKIHTYATILQDVPYPWAHNLVLQAAQKGQKISEAPHIAAAWNQEKQHRIRTQEKQLDLPDGPPQTQRAWLHTARTALAAGATATQAQKHANQVHQLAELPTAEPIVDPEESRTRLRHLIGQFKKQQHATDRYLKQNP